MPLIMAAVAGLVCGILGYFLFPILLGAVDRDRVPVGHYIGTAMGILGRGLAIKRKNGGWWLRKSKFDAKYQKERCSINGETRHFDDPEALMSRLYGYPFGIAHEMSGTIINPRFAELGEALRKRKRTGSLLYEHGGETWFNGLVRVADRYDRLVNVDDALALMSGNADPGTTDWAEEITEKSQLPFMSGNFIDYMGGVVVLAAGFGVVWLAHELTKDGGSNVNIAIGTVDLTPLLDAGVALL